MHLLIIGILVGLVMYPVAKVLLKKLINRVNG